MTRALTHDQVRAFQTTETIVDGVLGRPCDWLGEPLRDDGDLGPRTRWAMAMAALDPRRQAVVRRACSGVGRIRETVANRGPGTPGVDWLLRRCGIHVPEDPDVPMPDLAWCAAYASWCVSVPGLPNRAEAGARALAQSLRSAVLVLPGDLAWFPTGKWQAHIAPIIGVGPGVVATAEGNHGNECALAIRSTSEVQIVTPFPVEELPAVPPGLTLVPVRREGTR
jgi:hypothetical protein